ncbi:hypothetical protein E3Q08_02529 [Wallemia mellicola]|nr:hypothetical protein E3Q21_02317 [Wallemia mellicola]TIB87808.1 hypothetical protein E3Q20_02312 [Wallemia mellicola]TIC35195.1 hypothetical protein E3Q09_02478 [Wallemia mellicola]TIC40161.1 hypothetical protein E3Q07_02329 [Wallemia mellicola]TIC42967.1 hypothetical protein E3Q08_02529 [Wallemia mellicola]
MGRKKSGNELPKRVTLYDDEEHIYKLKLDGSYILILIDTISQYIENTRVEDCIEKINKKMKLKNKYTIRLILTRSGKDLVLVNSAEDFEKAKKKSRGYLKCKFRFELEDNQPSTPIQSTSQPRLTTTAKKRLSLNPSFINEAEDPTSPLTKQSRRVLQPRSAIMSKTVETYPDIQDYFAAFVKDTIHDYFNNTLHSNTQSEQSSVASNRNSKPGTLSAMRSTVVYDSDISEAHTNKGNPPIRLHRETTPSEVDQLQSSPHFVEHKEQALQQPRLEGLQEVNEDTMEVASEEDRPGDKEKYKRVEEEQEYGREERQKEPEPIEEQLEEQIEGQDEGHEGKSEDKHENDGVRSSPIEQFDDDITLTGSQIPPSAQPQLSSPILAPEQGLETVVTPVHPNEEIKQDQQESQQEGQRESQQEQEQQDTRQGDLEMQQPEEYVPADTESLPSPFKRPSPVKKDRPANNKNEDILDEELDLAKLFGSSTQGSGRPRRSIQAVLGDEKDDEHNELLMEEEANDEDEVMTDYESDDTIDRERERAKLSKSTQSTRRGSSDDNFEADDDEEPGEDKDKREPAMEAPPVVHSTSQFYIPDSPTASERAVSAQINAHDSLSISVNQSFSRQGDTSLLQNQEDDNEAENGEHQQYIGSEILPPQVHDEQSDSRDAKSEDFLQDEKLAEGEGEEDQPERTPQRDNGETSSIPQSKLSPQPMIESGSTPDLNQTQLSTVSNDTKDRLYQEALGTDNTKDKDAQDTTKDANEGVEATPAVEASKSQDVEKSSNESTDLEKPKPALGKRSREEAPSDEDESIQETKRTKYNDDKVSKEPKGRARHSEGGIYHAQRKIAMPPRLSINFDDLIKQTSKGPRSSSSFLPLSELKKDKSRYAIESPMASPRASPAVESRPRPSVKRVATSDNNDNSSSSDSDNDDSSSDEEEAKRPRRKMMSSYSKYSTLPDIDTAPDVYETEEPAPHSSQMLSDEEEFGVIQNTSNDAIDAAKLPNPKSATKKFRRKRFDAIGEQDFSGSVASQSLQKLKKLTNDDSSESSSSDEDDLYQRRKGMSTEDRLNLLKTELNDIEQSASREDNSSELQKQRKPQVINEIPESVTHNEVKESEQSNQIDDIGLIDLDRRIKSLEKSVGTDTLMQSTERFPVPLVNTIQKLEQQMSLLTQPRHLDAISRRLKLLNSELEKVNESKSRLSSDNNREITETDDGSQQGSTGMNMVTQNKVDKLFNSLERIEPLIPLTPHVLDRLTTLSEVHRKASNSVSDIDELKLQTMNISNNIKTLNDATSTLSQSLEENDKLVKSNVDNVMMRIEEISSRLASLQQK